MAERIAYLEAVVGADITNFRKGMRDVRGGMAGVSAAAQKLQNVGRTLTYAVTAPLLAMGGAAVKQAASFDASMRNIGSIVELTGAEFEGLSARVLQFGKDTREGPVASANALYTVFSAGLGLNDTNYAFEVMNTSVKTAEAGLADLEVTTEAVVGALLAFGENEVTAERASDALTRMVQVGVGPMQDFASALSNVTPTAAAAGMEIEELYGDIAFLTQKGFSASKATTALNMGITAMTKPTEAMSAAFQQLGVRGLEDLMGKFGGVNGAMKALVGTTDGTLEGVQKLFNNIRGARAVFAMSSNDFQDLEASISDFNTAVVGATDRAHQEQVKSFSYQFDLMKSKIEAAGIAFGSVLLPVLNPVIGGIADLFNQVADANPAVLQMAAVAGVAAAAMGPLLLVLSAMLTPVGLLAGAIGGLGVAISTNIGGIGDTINKAIEDLLGEEGVTAIDKILAILFPEEITALDVPTYEVETADIITIKEGDTLWGIWQDKYQGQFEWQEFLEAVGLDNPHILNIGDVIKIGGGSMAGGASSAGPNADLSANKLSGLPSITDVANANGPLAMSLLERIEEAVSIAVTQLGPKLEPLFTEAVAWADSHIGDALNAVAGWFTPSGGEGGDTPVYRAIKALLSGDFSQALDELIPGLGTNIGNAVSEIDWTKVLPKIQAGVGNLLTSVGGWLVSDGVPTVAKSVGLFVGKFARLITDGIKAIPQLIAGGGEQAVAGVGETVVGPLVEGFQEGFGETGEGMDGVTDLLIGGLATAFVLKAGPSMLKHLVRLNFSGVIGSAISGAMWVGKQITVLPKMAASWLVTNMFGGSFMKWLGTKVATFPGLGAGVVKAIVTGLGAILTSPIAMGIIIALTLDSVTGISDTVRSLVDKLGESFGFDAEGKESLTGNIADAFEGTVYLSLGVIANITGDEENAQKWNDLGASHFDNYKTGFDTAQQEWSQSFVPPDPTTLGEGEEIMPGGMGVIKNVDFALPSLDDNPYLTAMQEMATQAEEPSKDIGIQLAEGPLEEMNNTLANAIAEGKIDPEWLKSALLTPMEEDWVATFEEGAPIDVEWLRFTGSIASESIKMAEVIAKAKGGVVQGITSMVAGVRNPLMDFLKMLTAIKLEATGAHKALAGFGNSVQGHGGGVSGSGPIPGASGFGTTFTDNSTTNFNGLGAEEIREEEEKSSLEPVGYP